MEKYQTLCSIGKGACGDVYLVRNTANQKCYALKKVELDESRKTRRKVAVLREARIMADLKHPHIVAFHESFFDPDDKYLYIVLDYCDGGTLEDQIRKASQNNEWIEEKQIIRWFLQIAMAVRYMHLNKVLHRDLKTENVFLNKSLTICKLGDFGIAKNLDTTLEVSSTCVGTPCYLSPEMCQDIPYTSKADIWALGCILYELCTLKPAFDAHNLISLFYKIVQAEYEPIPENYSDELGDVVDILLTKQPASRPSAQEILRLPFLKTELLAYIEENEYILQHQRLPTRQDSRPYTTNAIRHVSQAKPEVADQEVVLPSKVNRALSCRPSIPASTDLMKHHPPPSSKLTDRTPAVSTIVEESDDQTAQYSPKEDSELENKENSLTGRDRNLGSLDSEENQNTQSEKGSLEDGFSNKADQLADTFPLPAKTLHSYGVEERKFEEVLHRTGRKDLKSKRHAMHFGEIKRLSKTPEPFRLIIQEEQRSRSLTPDSAKKSRNLPHEFLDSKFSFFDMPDDALIKKAGIKNVSLSLHVVDGASPSGCTISGLAKLPPLQRMATDISLGSDRQFRRKQNKVQRTPRMVIPNALQVEEQAVEVIANEKQLLSSETPKVKQHSQSGNIENDKQSGTQECKSPPADSKKIPTEVKDQLKSDDSRKKKDESLAVSKLKGKGKHKNNSKNKGNGTKQNKKSHSNSGTVLKQQVERVIKKGTEVYYSDDFDEDSSCSEIEEDIPQEFTRKRTVTNLSHGLDVGDIPEDLPDGEVGTDLDVPEQVAKELDAVLLVARAAHEDIEECADDVIVDTAMRMPSANLLIRKQCRKQLGEEKYEKMKTMCQTEMTESEIRELASTLEKEDVKTFQLMTVVIKRK